MLNIIEFLISQEFPITQFSPIITPPRIKAPVRSSVLPQIIVGTKNAAYSRTLVNDEAVDGDLLMYYASIQKTYPLVFDAKICKGLKFYQ